MDKEGYLLAHTVRNTHLNWGEPEYASKGKKAWLEKKLLQGVIIFPMIATQAQNFVPFRSSISSKGWKRFATSSLHLLTYSSSYQLIPVRYGAERRTYLKILLRLCHVLRAVIQSCVVRHSNKGRGGILICHEINAHRYQRIGQDSRYDAPILPVIQGCYERLAVCIQCNRNIVNAKIAMVKNKKIEIGLIIVCRHDVWDEAQERPLGHRSNGTNGGIVILPPDHVAYVLDCGCDFEDEKSNAELACGSMSGTVTKQGRFHAMRSFDS